MNKLAWCVVLSFGVLVSVGCTLVDGPPHDQMNSGPQGTAPSDSRLGENYVAMTDNALLSDSSMSSVHFVPRTAELNGLGVRRLTRLAEIFKVYGGTILYDGTDAERDLRKDRMEKIKSFLVSCGLESDRFRTEEGLAGGAGMDANEAITNRNATRGSGDILIYFEQHPPYWTGGHRGETGGAGDGGGGGGGSGGSK